MSLCHFGVEGNDEAARVGSGSALCARALVKLNDNGNFHVA